MTGLGNRWFNSEAFDWLGFQPNWTILAMEARVPRTAGRADNTRGLYEMPSQQREIYLGYLGLGLLHEFHVCYKLKTAKFHCSKQWRGWLLIPISVCHILLQCISADDESVTWMHHMGIHTQNTDAYMYTTFKCYGAFDWCHANWKYDLVTCVDNIFPSSQLENVSYQACPTVCMDLSEW